MSAGLNQEIGSVEIQLDWFDEKETLVVTPRDQQRFEVQKDFAIEALRVQQGRREQFQKQIELLLQCLGVWTRQNGDRVLNAYLTLQDDAFAFVVVRSNAKYDASFEDALSELDFGIANDPALDLIKLHAIALPPVSKESLLSFLDKRLIFVLPLDGK